MFTTIVIILNLTLVLIIVILEHKKPQSIIFWSTLTCVFSIFGFLLYVVLGSKLKFRARQKILNKYKSTKKYLSFTFWHKYYNKNNKLKLTKAQQDIIKYNQDLTNSNIWFNNNIKYYFDVNEYRLDLLESLKNAKNDINILMYIFSDDTTGQTISNILQKKAKQGIKINVIYDAVGSRKTSKKFWDALKKSGVNVYSFFSAPSIVINLKANYRNHRKIIIIDGKEAYAGGINLRDDHMGKSKRLFPWRDTQIKITGSGVYPLQDIFLNDLCYIKNKDYNNEEINKFFPPIYDLGSEMVQVIPSGPETDVSKIRKVILNIIKKAKKFIYIQTPYFIIDREIINLLLDMKRKGVEIKIMIPKVPDKKNIYDGTIFTLKELIEKINIYLYHGFIHSKVIISDNVVSIGSVNMDYRSFNLNFEVSNLLYSKTAIKLNKIQFMKDIKNSTKLDKKTYIKLKTKNFFKIIGFKILSKLL